MNINMVDRGHLRALRVGNSTAGDVLGDDCIASSSGRGRVLDGTIKPYFQFLSHHVAKPGSNLCHLDASGYLTAGSC